MGLDQYAHAAFERGTRRQFWANARLNKKTGNYEGPYPKPHDVGYWRRHQQLQRWMDNLWREKGEPYPEESNDPRWGSVFNGVELELEWSDIQRLDDDIENCRNGFNKNCHYRETDLQFCLDAKEQIFFFRKRVFYYSSW